MWSLRRSGRFVGVQTISNKNFIAIVVELCTANGLAHGVQGCGCDVREYVSSTDLSWIQNWTYQVEAQ
jgi:hypothetical protein